MTQAPIDRIWDFDAPQASETRFRAAAADAHDESLRLELLTQLARAQGLQCRFEDAHRTLDEVEATLAPHGDAVLSTPFATAHVRLLLERGRLFNSSGQREKALPLFIEAFEAANRIPNDHLAVDAAHMIAIVHGWLQQHDEAMEWNARALQMAENSTQPRARQWRGSLHNNIGWTLHDNGQFVEALSHFEKALGCRLEDGNRREIAMARWCIARCLRSLGRLEEALSEQQALLRAREASGEEPDGFVHEEIAECLLAQGRRADAARHFARAHQLLSRITWLVEQQPDRLERLRQNSALNLQQPHR